VILTLERINEWRGQPGIIRWDNGSEHINGTFLAWADRRGIQIEHIQLGKPQRNNTSVKN
jgi:putative transposase